MKSHRAISVLMPARARAGISAGITVALVAPVMIEHGDTSPIPLALYLFAISLCLPALLLYPEASATPTPPTGPAGDRGDWGARAGRTVRGRARPFLPAALAARRPSPAETSAGVVRLLASGEGLRVSVSTPQVQGASWRTGAIATCCIALHTNLDGLGARPPHGGLRRAQPVFLS